MLRLEDLGELTYGGLVTLSNWWDQKRIDEGKILKKDIFKKMETWTYLVPGVGAIAASAMGWMPRQAVWIEKVQTGFIYDAPRFVKGIMDALKTETATRSRAVEEAQRILRQSPRAQRLETGRYPAEHLTREFQGIRLVG